MNKLFLLEATRFVSLAVVSISSGTLLRAGYTEHGIGLLAVLAYLIWQGYVNRKVLSK